MQIDSLAPERCSIKYRTAPGFATPVALLLFFAIQCLLIIGPPQPSVDPFYFPAPQPDLDWVLGGICPNLLLAALLIMAALGRSGGLSFSSAGISFPVNLAPDLLFRLSRPWSDVAEISIDQMQPGPAQEDDCQPAGSVSIHFRSGGHADLNLSKMKASERLKLFASIHRWGRHYVQEPDLLDENLKEPNQAGSQSNAAQAPPSKQTGQADFSSFTTMWETELASHFATTNYVPLAPGTSLQGGRLKVTGQLTAGGLSTIYLVEGPHQELLVLKEAVIPATVDLKTKAKAKELFDREASLLKKLNHPAIASIIDHFSEGGRDYLLLQYIAGHNLRQWVRRKGPQKESVVLAWAQQIADILDYLHRQDPPVIHRDLTPDNLVLKEDGSIVLVDFGAANEYVGTATGTLIGKQSYIAPEQFRGQASCASDIYSLGCTLFYLLTGSDPEALAVSRPGQVHAYLSPEFDSLVSECTALQTEERISSAAALSERLANIAHSPRTIQTTARDYARG